MRDDRARLLDIAEAVVLLFFAGLTATAMSGCGAAASVPRPRLLYQSTGTIASLNVQPDGQQRFFLIADFPRLSSAQSPGRLKPRLVRLDTETADVRVIKDVEVKTIVMGFELVIAYARNGRVAFLDATRPPYHLYVFESDGSSRAAELPPEGSAGNKGWNIVSSPVWHPDSEHLLYVHGYLPDRPGAQ
jgi:hypothetical protein